MFCCFNNKGLERIQKEVTSVLEQKNISFKYVYEEVRNSFLKNKEYGLAQLTQEEEKLLKKIFETKKNNF